MNLLKDLWAHLKEWSDWKMKDWIKAGIVAIIVLIILSQLGGGAQTMVWQLLAKPLLGVVADGVKGFVATKQAKQELKLTEIKATQKLKEDQIAGKVAWEQSAVDQMKGSWKDEVSLIVLLLPAVLVFTPFQDHIHKGFLALQDLPSYYHNLLYIAISASFGIKAGAGAINMFKKK